MGGEGEAEVLLDAETVGVVLQQAPRLISPYTVCPLLLFPYPGLMFMERRRKEHRRPQLVGDHLDGRMHRRYSDVDY